MCNIKLIKNFKGETKALSQVTTAESAWIDAASGTMTGNQRCSGCSFDLVNFTLLFSGERRAGPHSKVFGNGLHRA